MCSEELTSDYYAACCVYECNGLHFCVHCPILLSLADNSIALTGALFCAVPPDAFK